MSDALHPTRLRFDGQRGIARHDGVEVTLPTRPEGLRYYDIDFEPGTVAQVRDRACDIPRDMSSEEIAAVQAALKRMARMARGSL